MYAQAVRIGFVSGVSERGMRRRLSAVRSILVAQLTLLPAREVRRCRFHERL